MSKNAKGKELMKKKIFKGLFILLIIFGVMGTTAFALNRGDSFVENGIHYEVIEAGKLKVTFIENIEDLESIEIPGSLTHDGESYIMTQMDSHIFDSAINLKRVSIPDSLKADNWFLKTIKLEQIDVHVTGQSDPQISSQDGVLFMKDRGFNALLCFPAGRGGEYTIPNDVFTIVESAFFNACHLEVLNIPTNCTNDHGGDFWEGEGVSKLPFVYYDEKNSKFITALREIRVSPDNLNLASADGVLYERGSDDTLSQCLYFPGNWQEEIWTIPANLNTSRDIVNTGMLLAPYLKDIVCPESVSLGYEECYDGCIYKYGRVEVIPRKKETMTIPNSADIWSINNCIVELLGQGGIKLALKEIKVNSDNPDYISIDGIIYDKVDGELLLYPIGRTDQEYTIKDGVTDIGALAFFGAEHLKSLIIPESVETIGQTAFAMSSCEYVFIQGNNLNVFPNDAFAEMEFEGPMSSIVKAEGNLKAIYCESTNVMQLVKNAYGDKANSLIFDATFEPATMNDDVEVVQNEDGTVSLNWSGNSDGYEIRRYESNKRSAYVVAGKVDGITSYTDIKADQGVQYKYSVVPYSYYKSRSNHEDDPFKDTIQYGDEKFAKQEVYIEKTYTVKFLDKDGNLLKEEPVKENESATAPEIPVIKGYTFKKWDKEFTNVQSNLEVKAIYTENKKPEIVPPNNEVVEPDHNETPLPDHTDNNDKLIFDSIATDNGIHYDANGNKVKVDEKGNKVETSDTAMISCLTLLMIISGGYIALKKYNS